MVFLVRAILLAWRERSSIRRPSTAHTPVAGTLWFEPLSPHGLAVAIGRLEKRRDRLLRRIKTHPDNERLAKHLDKHGEQLFTFLKAPGIDATNYRAEQAMRPAAVNRKVWGGNRTAAGAHAQSVLMTVLRTCRQQIRDTLRFIAETLCGRRPRLLLLPAGP